MAVQGRIDSQEKGFFFLCLLPLFSLLACTSHAAPSFPIVSALPRHLSPENHHATHRGQSHTHSPHSAGAPAALLSVNMVDLLWNYIGQGPNNASHSQAIMSHACSRGFTFVRFSASAYWPLNMQQLYFQDPVTFYTHFDALIADAKAANCSLMPSFLWNPFVFADLSHEPLGTFLSTATTSQSRALYLGFVQEIVARYRAEPTIVAWELWNEITNMADADLGGTTLFCYVPLGTPASRTRADNFSTDDLIGFQAVTTQAIRSVDTLLRRPINSGNDVPRANAEHMRASYHTSPQDLRPDTKDQFAKNLLDVNTHCDWVSMHLYSPGENQRWEFKDPTNAELVVLAKAAADTVGKPFYLGEFGDQYPGERPFSVNVLDALQRSRTPLATIWIWEFYQFNSTLPADFSLVPGRDDVFIARMQQYNKNATQQWGKREY